MNATIEKYFEPVQQLNALTVANIEKLVNRQLAAINEAAEISVNQLKSAVEVKDVEGLQTYLQGQAEAARTISERFVEDSKYAVELGTEFNNEVQKLIKESAADKA